jgi:hypothetical protein
MANKTLSLVAVAGLVAAAYFAGRDGVGLGGGTAVAAENGALTALDYQEITQLINRYAYGIDTCGNDGRDYANVFTEDGQFIDNNSDAGYAVGGRVLAKGRDALAKLVGGGPDGCKVMPWTGWSHLMLNHQITATPEGASGRVYLVQLGMRGPGSVDRHGGYEDTYVKTPEGWRIKTRMHVRNRAWFSPGTQSADLN